METKFIDSLSNDLIGSINLIKIFYYLTVEEIFSRLSPRCNDDEDVEKIFTNSILELEEILYLLKWGKRCLLLNCDLL